jgi:hypothetical protein
MDDSGKMTNNEKPTADKGLVANDGPASAPEPPTTRFFCAWSCLLRLHQLGMLLRLKEQPHLPFPHLLLTRNHTHLRHEKFLLAARHLGEVHLRPRPAEPPRERVVGTRGKLGGLKSAEPLSLAVGGELADVEEADTAIRVAPTRWHGGAAMSLALQKT